jgi:hypothetical protein
LAAQADELLEVCNVLQQLNCTSQVMTWVGVELPELSAELADLTELTDLI